MRSPGLSFLNRLPLKLIQWAARVTWNIVIVVVVVVVVASPTSDRLETVIRQLWGQ